MSQMKTEQNSKKIKQNGTKQSTKCRIINNGYKDAEGP